MAHYKLWSYNWGIVSLTIPFQIPVPHGGGYHSHSGGIILFDHFLFDILGQAVSYSPLKVEEEEREKNRGGGRIQIWEYLLKVICIYFDV